MSGSEKTRARVAALDRQRERNTAQVNRSCVSTEVCCGSSATSLVEVAADLDALAARVAALEAQPRIVTAGSQDDDRVSPAPPAPLVERMAREFEIVPEWLASAGTVNARRAVARNLARAALLVAAEELLGEITLDEWEDACTRYGSNAPGATTNGVLRSRLARAKEAARG